MKPISFLNEEDNALVSRFYDKAVEDFLRDGQYDPPVMILVDDKNKLNILAGSFQNSDYGQSKDMFAMAARHLARKVNARMCIFFSEAWTVTYNAETVKDVPENIGSLAEHPDRKEVLLMTVEVTGAKFVNTMTDILRDENGVVSIGEYRASEVDDKQGRFCNILPTLRNKLPDALVKVLDAGLFAVKEGESPTNVLGEKLEDVVAAAKA